MPDKLKFFICVLWGGIFVLLALWYFFCFLSDYFGDNTSLVTGSVKSGPSNYAEEIKAVHAMLKKMEQDDGKNNYELLDSLTGQFFRLTKQDFHHVINARPQYPELN